MRDTAELCHADLVKASPPHPEVARWERTAKIYQYVRIHYRVRYYSGERTFPPLGVTGLLDDLSIYARASSSIQIEFETDAIGTLADTNHGFYTR